MDGQAIVAIITVTAVAVAFLTTWRVITR